MLILTRKRHEEIVMDGGRIRLVVVELRGDKVRLGIEAPREVSVDRREVFEAKRASAVNSHLDG